MLHNSTIVALSTPPGISALAVIRLTGSASIEIVESVWRGKSLQNAASHTAHFGVITDGNTALDEVVITLFKAPKSFTGETVVEISCHGNPIVVQNIINLLIEKGAQPAEPGEFTKRAFLNGKLDLSQAEAVADIIHAQSSEATKVAMHQLKGKLKQELQFLRSEILAFSALLELELDFSEEDVEFADRAHLKSTLNTLKTLLQTLTDSFRLGNAIKNGFQIVIAGAPNAGKSTLLNALLQEERAIVSPIAGTTRDFIEDTLHINGILYRFTDTAGLRVATDSIEAIGIERAREKLASADLVLFLFDASASFNSLQLEEELLALTANNTPYLLIANKLDLLSAPQKQALQSELAAHPILFISAAQETAIVQLREAIVAATLKESVDSSQTLITNARHYSHLYNALLQVEMAMAHLEGHSTDYVAMDLRIAMNELGMITGEITTDEILGNIFSRFCIGK